MPKRKLTDKVKQEIKSGRGRARLKDYSGEAKDYARYYNRLIKGVRRKNKQDKKADEFYKLLLQEEENTKSEKQKKSERLVLEGVEIKKDTELYDIASKLAAQKKIPVSRLKPSEVKALATLAANGRLPFAKESDYVLNEMNSAASVFYKKVKTRLVEVRMKLTRMRNVMYANAKIYHYLIMPYYYNLKGDLFISFPDSTEYRPVLKLKGYDIVTGLRGLLNKYKIRYTPND